MEVIRRYGPVVIAFAVVLVGARVFTEWTNARLMVDVAVAGGSSDKAVETLMTVSSDLTKYCLAAASYAIGVALMSVRLTLPVKAMLVATFLCGAAGIYTGLALKLSMAVPMAQGALLSGAEPAIWRGIAQQWTMLECAMLSMAIAFVLVVEARSKEPRS